MEAIRGFGQEEHDEYQRQMMEALEQNLSAAGFMDGYSSKPRTPPPQSITPVNSGH